MSSIKSAMRGATVTTRMIFDSLVMFARHFHAVSLVSDKEQGHRAGACVRADDGPHAVDAYPPAEPGKAASTRSATSWRRPDKRSEK
jgi:hypothetical protein